ncbi:SIS domain-containing protein [Alteriqipengyuania lutimaris]|uniref:SIS domain-containing protein n=1 Tax=Alteriqipengyuania lutimaris TaxID=1538146 RepID=UPI0017FD6FFB|nr:SIS domain-containing protein [Alteriqipengyuania lutimaris]MBB3034855.1 glucosamine--fructose-6-phosphate aminotransferase (isomerizing) [Alteriqipengyuania lutimaris]
MNPSDTQMYREAGEAPGCVARQSSEAGAHVAAIGAALRDLSPRLVATIARGSSDHAATYAKYLIETATGVPVASFAPSVSSVYEARRTMRGAACIAISQSGRSPDLVAAAQSASRGGALSIALVNDTASPLAEEADLVAPLCAFPETAVAATKSYLASLALMARFVASWSQDAELEAAIDRLPEAMERAWALDWGEAERTLTKARSLFVIGRGSGLGIAQEAALKFKETCRIHAEAYSAAEVLHGPAAVVRDGFPVLAFAQDDASRNSVGETCARLAAMGARVFIAGAQAPGCTSLPSLAQDARLQPILLAQAFYRLANACAVELGENPDAPPHLMKVTETT